MSGERFRSLVSVTALALTGCGGAASPTAPARTQPPSPTRTQPPADREPSTATPPNELGIGAGAPIRIAVDLVGLRATPEGRLLAHALSTFPQAVAFREASGVDAFEDGTWLVAYGTNFVEPDASTLVVRHTLAADQLRPHSEKAATSRERLVRPQPDVVALVASGAGRSTSTELPAALDPPITPGELVRMTMRDASWRFPLLPREIDRVHATVRAADGGSFDVSATGVCASVSACATGAEKLRATATRFDALLREDLRGLLASVARDGVHPNGTRVEITVHVTPDQARALASSLADYAAPHETRP